MMIVKHRIKLHTLIIEILYCSIIKILIKILCMCEKALWKEDN